MCARADARACVRHSTSGHFARLATENGPRRREILGGRLRRRASPRVTLSHRSSGADPSRGPVRCSSAGYAARRAPAGPLSAGMTTTAHAPRRGGPGSDELLVTRQPERDDDPPLPCRPVGVAVEDLPPGDPELLLSAAAQQIQAFVAQHDAVHLDVSASHAPRAVATVVAHVRTLLSLPYGPKVAPRHSGRRRAPRRTVLRAPEVAEDPR